MGEVLDRVGRSLAERFPEKLLVLIRAPGDLQRLLDDPGGLGSEYVDHAIEDSPDQVNCGQFVL